MSKKNQHQIPNRQMDNVRDIFPVVHRKTLSLESLIQEANTVNGRWDGTEPKATPGEEGTAEKSHRHGGKGGDSQSYKSHRSSRSLQKQRSGGSRSKSTGTHHRKRNRRSTLNVKSNYYAGIAHSDLDIQTGRPPLMHQMSVLEWFWFKSDTSLRLIVLGISVLFVFALLQLGLAMYLLVEGDVWENPYVCHNRACKTFSKRLLEKLNQKMDPCNDFYAFVCGSRDVTRNRAVDMANTWQYDADLGSIKYDFSGSQSLGKMLKKCSKEYPQRLILDLYQPCIDENQRRKLGLQPYYDTLKKMKLFDVSLASWGQPRPTDLFDTMALIISHSLESGIIKIVFYMSDDSGMRAHIQPTSQEPYSSGAVFRYGYKKYLQTIQEALKLLQADLQITPNEMEILPHDFLCLDAYFFKDAISKKNYEVDAVVSDPDNVNNKICEVAGSTPSTQRLANFNITVDASWSIELLVRKLFKLSNPSWDENSPTTPFGNLFSSFDPMKDPRSDIDFITRFHEEFKLASSFRIMRYLQWRVFYGMAAQLDTRVKNIMIEIQRHEEYGLETNCFHNVFTKLPMLATIAYMNESDRKTEDTILEKHLPEATFERAKYGVAHLMEAALNKVYTDRNKEIINNITMENHKGTVNFPTEYYKPEYKNLPDLFADIKLDPKQHINNLLVLGRRIFQWKTSVEFAPIFYQTEHKLHHTPYFDKAKVFYDRLNLSYHGVLPLGLIEAPFSHEGLWVSTLSGLGVEASDCVQTNFMASLVFELNQQNLVEKFKELGFTPAVNKAELDEMIDDIIKYHGVLREKLKIQLYKAEFGGEKYNQIRDGPTLHQVLAILLQDQGNIQMAAMIKDHFLMSERTHWEQRKGLLPDLEEYDVSKLFYISLVNRNCDEVGENEFQQRLKYGPVPHQIRNNLVLSNVEDFSTAFKCPANSPMNGKEKVYFYDRNYYFFHSIEINYIK